MLRTFVDEAARALCIVSELFKFSRTALSRHLFLFGRGGVFFSLEDSQQRNTTSKRNAVIIPPIVRLIEPVIAKFHPCDSIGLRVKGGVEVG